MENLTFIRLTELFWHNSRKYKNEWGLKHSENTIVNPAIKKWNVLNKFKFRDWVWQIKERFQWYTEWPQSSWTRFYFYNIFIKQLNLTINYLK